MNGFKGALPEEGMGTLTAVVAFSVCSNDLKGVLPESGLQAMRTMSFLFVDANRFAGTLPNRAFAGFERLSVRNNDFEGKMSQTQCGIVLQQ
eukprot:1032448-Amphidinium_carterae.1